MLIQKKVNKKKNTILAIVAVVFFIVTVGLIFYLLRSDSEEPPPDLGAQGTSPFLPTQVAPKFSTEILDDARIKELKLHGPAEVQVQLRGRKDDPFAAF